MVGSVLLDSREKGRKLPCKVAAALGLRRTHVFRRGGLSLLPMATVTRYHDGFPFLSPDGVQI
jgi:hypothetical protein